MPYYRSKKSYFINGFKYVLLDTIAQQRIQIGLLGNNAINETPNPNRVWFNLGNGTQCLAYKLISPVVNQCTLAGVAGSLDYTFTPVVVQNQNQSANFPLTNPISIGYSVILINNEQWNNITNPNGNYNGWGVISKNVYPVTENLLCYDQGILNREINLKTFEFSPKTKRVMNENDMLVLTVYHNIPLENQLQGYNCMISGSLRFFVRVARR